MRKQEQKLWDRMRHALKDQVYLERIENVVTPGRPDVDVMHNGITLPVELKSIPAWPRKSTTPVLGRAHGLSQNQLNWWLQWQRWGGRGFILVSVAGELFAMPGKFSEEINSCNVAHFVARRVTWAEFVLAIKQEAECVQRP